jgi:hypothetical protein
MRYHRSAQLSNALSPTSKPGGLLSEKAGRYRAPTEKYRSMLAIIGLLFFCQAYEYASVGPANEIRLPGQRFASKRKSCFIASSIAGRALWASTSTCLGLLCIPCDIDTAQRQPPSGGLDCESCYRSTVFTPSNTTCPVPSRFRGSSRMLSCHRCVAGPLL